MINVFPLPSLLVLSQTSSQLVSLIPSSLHGRQSSATAPRPRMSGTDTQAPPSQHTPRRGGGPGLTSPSTYSRTGSLSCPLALQVWLTIELSCMRVSLSTPSRHLYPRKCSCGQSGCSLSLLSTKVSSQHCHCCTLLTHYTLMSCRSTSCERHLHP
jgi:hypothetical protein